MNPTTGKLLLLVITGVPFVAVTVYTLFAVPSWQRAPGIVVASLLIVWMLSSLLWDE